MKIVVPKRERETELTKLSKQKPFWIRALILHQPPTKPNQTNEGGKKEGRSQFNSLVTLVTTVKGALLSRAAVSLNQCPDNTWLSCKSMEWSQLSVWSEPTCISACNYWVSNFQSTTMNILARLLKMSFFTVYSL